MPPDDFIMDFVRRMDAKEFEGKLTRELSKLTKEQLEELALILARRSGWGPDDWKRSG